MSRLEIVRRVRDIEAHEVGTAERPGDDVKYNTAYYGHRVHDGHPPGVNYYWCVVYQWWCFQKAGIPTSVFPKSANVFAVRDWFKRKGRFYRTPMPGDLVIFAISHIGFVEKLLADNHIQTIEGNSGDAVQRHTYRADDPGIQGYCRPEYHRVPVAPMALDTSKAYRLTNHTLGSGRSLDGTARLTTASSNDGPGQRWRLHPRDGGTYRLTTEALGPCYAIDVTNDDGHTYTPVLVPAADFTGQMWHVESLSGGAFHLRSKFPDHPHRSLGVDEHGALVTRPGTAQRWRLTPLAPASPAPARGRIPQLCPRGGVSQTEGHADYTVQLVPRGVLRAVVIFADFDDAPGGVDPAVIGARVHGSGAATQLFHEQSYGALELEVTVRSDLGWRRLPNPSTAYDFGNGRKQRQFMTDAAARIGADELRFDDYALVLAVTPETAKVGLSPAYHHVPGDGAPSASGEILHGVTFGRDLYHRDHRVLVHELGHVMGLPDLYPHAPGERCGTCRPAHPGENLVGYWDLMSDVDHGEHFLGWHRHKNGWLPPARSTYIDRATTPWRVTLHPLSGPDGLSMVVVPCDNIRRPRKVLVVEPAEPLQDLPQTQGVLIYSVDSGIDGGDSPVAIHSREGHGLDDAPHRVGDVADIEDGGAHLRVTVLGRTGPAWDIEISFTPAPHD